jgi:hypothetical protein
VGAAPRLATTRRVAMRIRATRIIAPYYVVIGTEIIVTHGISGRIGRIVTTRPGIRGRAGRKVLQSFLRYHVAAGDMNRAAAATKAMPSRERSRTRENEPHGSNGWRPSVPA